MLSHDTPSGLRKNRTDSVLACTQIYFKLKTEIRKLKSMAMSRYLFNAALSFFLKKRYQQLVQMMRQPMKAQENVFQQLIKQAANTHWGKKYDYQNLSSISEFQQRLPLQNYDDLKPYIQQAIKGATDVLWKGKVTPFATTSGTTSERTKFIPITKEAIYNGHFKASKDALTVYCHNRPNTKIFTGKGLSMGGSFPTHQPYIPAIIGDLSAILLEASPWYIQYIRTPEHKVATMSNWEEKMERIVASVAKTNITHFAGMPSWNLVLIQKLLQQTKAEHLLEVWPNLAFYMHGGTSFTPYRQQFQQLIPSEQMYYMDIYNASEGFFALQDQSDREDLLLLLAHGIFYEFVAIEDIHQDFPKTYLLDEVELGRQYVLVISTNAGLWRYYIGDTILFTSKYPFRIKLTGRTKLFLNAVGERLKIEDVERAMQYACKQHQVKVNEYTVVPSFLTHQGSARHDWLVEFLHPPHNQQHFIATIDTYLHQINSDYATKRMANLALISPQLIPVSRGTFYHWLKAKDKLGGQHKIPRLLTDSKKKKEILAYQ